MKHFMFLLITVIELSVMQFSSIAKANVTQNYACEIQQTNFKNGTFSKVTYAKAIIDVTDPKSKSLLADMPRFQNDTEKMRVILDISPSLDKSKIHLSFTAVDKHNSTNYRDWNFGFQMINEFPFGTQFILLQSNDPSYMAEYSCSLLTP